MLIRCLVAVLALCVSCVAVAQTQRPGPIDAPRAYRQNHAVRPISPTTVIAEAEEFAAAGTDAGWRSLPWGANYYAATFANSFMSRKAFLGAPEQLKGEGTSASISVVVPQAGRYLALVRYEAVARFQTRFRLRVEQGGVAKLDRVYGARENPKIWAFRNGVVPEVEWSWGAVENVVWEGHDAAVDLVAGPATLTLIAGEQPEPAARRNIDLVMLTTEAEQVAERIAKENYLPLDGMLTQASDVFVKIHNAAASPAMKLTINPGTEHSPYWVHLRNWKPVEIDAAPGQATDWVEVGGLLDSLNDGQWQMTAKATGADPNATPHFSLEFGVAGADGQIGSIRRIDDISAAAELAYFADTRYSRSIRTGGEVLFDLLDHLRKQTVPGTAPKRTLIYGYTFNRNNPDPRYVAGVDEFCKLMGATALMRGDEASVQDDGPLIRGYIDLRGQSPEQLKASAAKLKAEGRAEKMAVVSLGDEIGLERPKADDHAAFRQWLQSKRLQPTDIDPAAGGNWDAIQYNPASDDAAKQKPGVFYYSRLYDHHYGIAAQKRLTDALRPELPNAGIGANFSPHHGHMYLGETYQWITLFREGGMTMPWGEDYIWQVPVASHQVNFICLDQFRAGIRGKPDAKIHYYVMPHAPGNTTRSWRRLFYGTLAHGAKVLNLFEFRPVQAAYTENHVTSNEMYDAVRRALHELGTFEDLVQDGSVRAGVAGLWFSETGDIWNDNRAPFDAAKRSLYCAIRHQQLPLDFLIEPDALSGTLQQYRVLYLADQHVSRAASKAIAEWVTAGGGRLFATAGAGMFDEFNQPNTTLRQLFGIDQQSLEEPKQPVRLEKQDLPFAKPIDTVKQDGSEMPVIDVRSRIKVAEGAGAATVKAQFSDGSPAVTAREAGKGSATYCAFLPGLSYFKPAIPLRPVDRGSTDDAMTHFIPTQFNAAASALIASPAAGVERAVTCSEPLVETTIIDSPHGVLIPLMNWSAAPVKQLRVTLAFAPPAGAKPRLASGGSVEVGADGRSVTFDLDVADALVFDTRQ